LLDPTSDELDVCDSQFSIYIDHSGVLCGQTKRGGKAISRQDVATCMNAAKQRIPSFLALINI
jgi:exosome complex RNA-binding protein Rrp42 (RNase PH superfamily)